MGPGTSGLSCGTEIQKGSVYPKWTARLMLGEVELSSSMEAGNIYMSLVDSRYVPYSCHTTFKNKQGGLPIPPGAGRAWAWGSISSSWVASTIQLTGSAMGGMCFSGSYWSSDWRDGSGSLSGSCGAGSYYSVGVTSSAMMFPLVAGTGYNIKNVVMWQTASVPGANDDYLMAVFRYDHNNVAINITPDGDNITLKFPQGMFTWGFRSY